jgi:hypothetical protein
MRCLLPDIFWLWGLVLYSLGFVCHVAGFAVAGFAVAGFAVACLVVACFAVAAGTDSQATLSLFTLSMLASAPRFQRQESLGAAVVTACCVFCMYVVNL